MPLFHQFGEHSGGCRRIRHPTVGVDDEAAAAAPIVPPPYADPTRQAHAAPETGGEGGQEGDLVGGESGGGAEQHERRPGAASGIPEHFGPSSRIPLERTTCASGEVATTTGLDVHPECEDAALVHLMVDDGLGALNSSLDHSRVDRARSAVVTPLAQAPAGRDERLGVEGADGAGVRVTISGMIASARATKSSSASAARLSGMRSRRARVCAPVEVIAVTSWIMLRLGLV
ncbi:MAG: hypothetical protein IPH03_13685 [Tetrasphaera sp.]|nr:hypothetical protein [Tetrasphaera sp.]